MVITKCMEFRWLKQNPAVGEKAKMPTFAAKL